MFAISLAVAMPRRSPQTWCRPVSVGKRRGLAFATLLAWGLACLSGCQTEPATTARWPTLQELAPQSGALAEASPQWPASHVVATALWLSLPGDHELADAWELTEPIMPLDQIWRHRANGLRAAKLTADQAEAFARALPLNAEPVLVRLGLGDGPSILPPELGADEPTHYQHALDDGAMALNVLPAGRRRWLLEAAPDKDGWIARLTPHVHRPRVTVELRPRRERLLDGDALNEHRIETHLSEGEVLVVSFDPGWASTAALPQAPEPAEDGDDDSGEVDESVDPPASGVASTPEAASRPGAAADARAPRQPEPGPALPRIGHLWMTDHASGRVRPPERLRQRMVMITLSRVGAAPAEEGAPAEGAAP